MKISIIGAGSWGTALSVVMGKRYRVKIWCYEKEVEEEIKRERENRIYLPSIKIPPSVHPSVDFEEVLREAEIVIFATPSHVTREVLLKALPFLPPSSPIISVTKGIEVESHKLMSEVYSEVLGDDVLERYAVLSGPTFAREVAAGLPAAATIASKNRELARTLQRIFSDERFRLYESADLTGVEIGGAVKNVIAIAAGISDGLGLGLNARSALITRGLAEMTRLGVKMGANPLTFLGLSGIGDLVLTCTGDLSRNRNVGIQLGKGKRLEEVIKASPMVPEGIKTSIAVKNLSVLKGVEMPISTTVYMILHEGLNPWEGVRVLMERSLKEELYGIYSGGEER